MFLRKRVHRSQVFAMLHGARRLVGFGPTFKPQRDFSYPVRRQPRNTKVYLFLHKERISLDLGGCDPL